MDKLIVAMLNMLGGGVSGSTVQDLLKTPAQYDGTVDSAMTTLHNTAVLPITAVVLSIVATMALSEAATKIDQGDRDLGVRMIFGVMLRVVVVLLVVQNAGVILKAIDLLASQLATSANGTNVGPTAKGQQLGDSLSGQIKSAGTTKQLVMIVVLLIPWMLAEVVSILATVLVFLRFLQLYVMGAFASLPIAFAGMDSTKNIAVGYVKRYAAVAFQGVVLVLSLKLYSAMEAAFVVDGGSVNDKTDVFDLITHHFGQFLIGPLVLAFLLFTSTSTARAILGDG